MTQNQNDNLHRGLAYVNTLLLGVSVFFLTRVVGNIDKLADNVVDMRVEMAKVQSTVDQHGRDIIEIKLKEKTQTIKSK